MNGVTLGAHPCRVQEHLPLSPPQALEKLQFLYLADNLLGSIPGPLPLSLRSLHLQVSRTPRARTLTGARDTEVR